MANKGKQILINQEAVAKQTKAIKVIPHYPYSITKHIRLDIITISITCYTYHITPSSQAILCQDIHPFTKLVDVPLWPTDYLDPVMEYQQLELSTPPCRTNSLAFHQLSIPQVATSSTSKAEIPLRLTHTPEIEYQSTLLTTEPEEPTDPSSSTQIQIQTPTVWLEIKKPR